MVVPSSVSSVAVLALGYLYPAYLTYKALERRKPEPIRTWCEYWLIIALFAVLESIGDQTLFWLPLYHETKVLFVVWLWHPRTQGAPHCYAAYVAPLLRRHEPALDAQLAEAGATVGGALGRQYRAAADYVSTSFLQLVAALPQRPTQQAADDGGGGGGGGGAAGPAFSPRTATEAAAAAFAAGPPPAAPHAKVF